MTIPLMQNGAISPLMADPGFVWELDFGLTEAAYAVVCLIQRYPKIRLPETEKIEHIGVER